MKISDFLTVIALTETGSITSAAKTLNRVPSAITTRLQNLEAELGTLLFIKSGGRFTPTLEGKALYENALKIIKLINAAEHQARQRNPEGKFRLGVQDSMVSTFLSAPLKEFQSTHRGVLFEFVTGVSSNLYKGVLDRELDAAFICDVSDNHALEQIKINNDELVIVAPANFPHIKAPADLDNSTLIVYREGCAYRDRLVSWLNQGTGISYQVTEVFSFQEIARSVIAGMGISLIPKSLLNTMHSINRMTVHPFLEVNRLVTTSLVWRRDSMTANVRALINLVTSEQKWPVLQQAQLTGEAK